MMWKRQQLLGLGGMVLVLGAAGMFYFSRSPQPDSAAFSETENRRVRNFESTPEKGPRPPESQGERELPPQPFEKAPGAAAIAEPFPETADAVYAEAVRCVQQLLDRAPNSPDCLEMMARLLVNMGRTREAEQHWKRALQLNPNYAYAYDGLAEAAAKRGDLEEAIPLFEKSLEIAPGAPKTLLEFSRVLLRMGQWDRAIELLRKHIQMAPRSLDGHLLLGEALLRTRDYVGAREAYLQAVSLAPDRPHAWYGLGMACHRLNQMDESQRHLKKCSELWTRAKETADLEAVFSDVDAARREVARIYVSVARLRAGLGDSDEAERLWRRAARFDPTAAEPLYLLAAHYRRTHRTSDAIEVARTLGGMSNGDSFHALEVAVLYAQLDQFEAAEAMLARCRELAPEASWPLRESAGFYLQVVRKPAEALSLAREAVEREPIAANYILLGEACRQTGDREGALAALHKARELEPANPNHAQALSLLESSP